MNLSLSAYTPLESFLLFQYLSQDGVTTSAFSRISDLLTSNPYIRKASNFDRGRLSPDALRHLYLAILKEEVKSELETAAANDHDSRNGDATNSRKRKAPSPSLPTVAEASQHAHLIPKLIAKLYTRFREVTVAQIRDEERRYDQFTAEAKEIERGEWDERIQRDIENGRYDALIKRHGLFKNGETPAGGQPAQVVGAPLSNGGSRATPGTPISAVNSPRPAAPLGPRSPSSKEPLRHTSIDAVIASTPPVPPNGQSAGPRPPSHPQAIAPSQRPATPTIAPSPSNTPRPIARHPSATPYQQTPLAHQSPYSAQPGQPPPHQGPVQHPSPTARPPSTPGAPQNNAQYPLSVPTYSDRPGPAYQQPHGAPPHAYPPNVPPQYAYGPPPGYPGYPPQPPPGQLYLPYGRGQPYPQPPRQGGIELQPWQLTPPGQTPRPGQQQGFQQGSPQVPGRDYGSPIDPRTGAPMPRAGRPLQPNAKTDLVQVLALLSHNLSRSRRPSAGPKKRFGNAKWKPDSNPLPPHLRRTPSPDRLKREISPILPVEETTGSRKGHQQKTTSAPKPRQNRNKRTRGGSVASSAVPGSVRGRSQSVASQGDMISIDNESVTGRGVKHEPSTPAEVPNISTTIESTPRADRPRRGTVQAAPSNKRKRSLRDESENSEVEQVEQVEPVDQADLASFTRPAHVTAVRRLEKSSEAVFDVIQSHKHGGLFSNPVKEKDAKGYHQEIKRPQDLKSIKAAIKAGANAFKDATKPTDASSSTNSPGAAASGHIVLPLSANLVPPKAIVNSAQLESELMRMFANAVMFNEGDDGVVQDTREMFEAVEKSVTNFRDAERTGE
ncbi:hypothetical protein K402DRAFT_125719 [Aulographum hederae CBS 113979]|uniref:Bromo domain-containing protein n=1 Tax=Aulographum hederae CBS 113979 TaxID=1176131 RepID=A0A6G1HE63_9PEZI|nr:hypothetical protein K402DRAFT_125719 [Aulographum hederae CBS 113979]